MKGIYALVIALIAGIFVSVQAEEKEGAPITIGVVYGFTGAAQVWSEYGRMGLELAQEEINQKGIKGRKISLVFEDSQSIPTKSVSAYQKLKTLDRVKIVIGNIWSYLTNPLIPLAGRDKTILFSPTGMPESIEQTNQYFFSMGERIASVRGAVDTFFKVNPEVERVGIFCWDDMWGQAYLKIWQEAADARGVRVVARACTSDFANDYKTDVTKIVSSRVDAVIIAHNAETIVRRLKEHRYTGKILATSNIVEDIKVKPNTKELFEGVFVTDWRPSEEFISKFKAKFNRDPIAEAHNSYETLHALGRALVLDEPDLINALKGLKYRGVAGPIDFSAAPFVNLSEAQLYEVHDGDFRRVEISQGL
jgi:ABC-type branched-subunit amino acid transport system substrate-binding protein